MRSVTALPERVATLDLWLRIADAAIVAGAAAVSYVVRFGNTLPHQEYRIAIGTVLLYATLCFWLSPIYRGWRGRSLARELGVLWLAWTIVFGLFSMHAMLVQMGNVISRQWLGYWYLLGYGGMAVARVCAHALLRNMRKQGIDMQRVIVIGLRTPILKLYRHLRVHPETGIAVAGYFASHHDTHSTSGNLPPCLGSLAALGAYLEKNHDRVEQVWISLPLSDRNDIKGMLRLLERYPVPVKLVPDISDFGILNPSVEQIGGVPVINLRQGVANPYYLAVKRIEDWLVAGIAVIVLSPVFLVLAIGVKLSSPGPVFFRQKRNGLGGREFRMLKFRSMRVHAEDPDKITQATKGDPRVTRFGAFLRRTSLDELPQFFNVLGGSMSVVGPRPHAVQHNNQYERLIDRYMQRHYVKPGITGWAQVHGFRGETPELRSMKKRVQYDLDYIRRWTPWLDIKIIVLTAVKVLAQKTAY
ncbi:undecaprenyl-phosphate glucose phosphotransferase [Stenotrophomonas sp. MMGLT7]|uniref:undecaprenyl-phosphate glucose phosphotransferase n=1 Tax=Stenotrophomonas sp. MMGLT7 TaxID=2901227 RepID=UPI001E567836|nr:undecaprenyl-phosphate glucose phosphotransferase [Stenotrophomonas sp. MMGLT7]MCD7099320.1 undecaprenyl-phosphate glucose phosphotransferase [Stenotrophomonas sp. MMGLT7]